MSKFPGGIFSKARGKVAGLVFSAARTREGKLMTARQLVIPANPQTAAQQSNRMIFDFVQLMIRILGPGIYRQDFNRGVQDLPGYQSMISLVRRTFFETSPGFWQSLIELPDVLQGQLHFPDSVTIDTPNNTASWSTELGTNGQATDEVTILWLNGDFDQVDPVQDVAGASITTAIRSDASVVLNDPSPGPTTRALVFFYITNPSNNEPDTISIIRSYQQATS